MSEKIQKLATVEQDSDIVQEDDWSEAPVINNTGNATVRDFDAASEDHPLVQYAGEKARKTDISGGGEFVSEEIYQGDEAFPREWLQNHETACIRRCKMVVSLSDEYPDDWLTQTVLMDPETGETVEDPEDVDGNAAAMEVPRPMNEIIEAARSLGYDPTITWDVYLDERKIITEDNGIGMTPREFWEVFKSPFSSGSGVDSETGGNFGIGSNSVEKAHGEDGAAKVTTKTPRPGNHEGYQAYSYRGGATAINGEVPDGFHGTRFEIPVREGFDLSKMQHWIEKYTDKLRVPVLYREHDAGSTPVEEEYEETVFVKDFDDPPIVIERPGEFSLVAGPDVCPRTRYSAPDNPDTYLVSMEIDRNTKASISTMYDVVIQIHDEQGRIVAGPHRGYHSHNGKVYKTGQNEELLDDLHEDDVVSPQPTGDRDRLKKTDESYDFFNYIEKIVKSEEINQVSHVADRMKDADHPGDAIRGEKGDWDLFRKTISENGPRHATDQRNRFGNFLNDRDEFPDFTDSEIDKMFCLFDEFEHCYQGPGSSNRKRGREERTIGYILSSLDPDAIYMAASTGGNFSDRFRVIENTYDNPEVVVINTASNYDTYAENFGFKVLKEVPVTQPDEGEDHDYNVTDNIHERHVNKGSSYQSKPDSVLDRALKIRNSADNTSIDLRLSIADAQERLENYSSFSGANSKKLVLFPRTADENISDHYGMAKYAAIASVNKKEYDQLAHYDDVMTYQEFKEWSRSALIATTDGVMTPKKLVEDDRMVVLLYRRRCRSGPIEKDEARFLMDEKENLRNLYLEDIRDQVNWADYLDGYDGGWGGDDRGNVDDADKPDMLLAVAGPKVLRRAHWAFNRLDISRRSINGLRLGRSSMRELPITWVTLDGSQSKYKLMVDTPNWDNDSEIYEMIPTNRDKFKAQMYLAFHDMGIDPSNYENEELREMCS